MSYTLLVCTPEHNISPKQSLYNCTLYVQCEISSLVIQYGRCDVFSEACAFVSLSMSSTNSNTHSSPSHAAHVCVCVCFEVQEMTTNLFVSITRRPPFVRVRHVQISFTHFNCVAQTRRSTGNFVISACKLVTLIFSSISTQMIFVLGFELHRGGDAWSYQ